MKAKKYTGGQIIAVLKGGEAGARIADLCRKYGISDPPTTIGKPSMQG